MSDRSDSITVQLRCFSLLKQALGRAELPLELPGGSTAADVETRVRALLPTGSSALVFRIAVNHCFAPATQELEDGDEIALLPPMQGG